MIVNFTASLKDRNLVKEWCFLRIVEVPKGILDHVLRLYWKMLKQFIYNLANVQKFIFFVKKLVEFVFGSR